MSVILSLHLSVVNHLCNPLIENADIKINNRKSEENKKKTKHVKALLSGHCYKRLSYPNNRQN